MKFQKM